MAVVVVAAEVGPRRPVARDELLDGVEGDVRQAARRAVVAEADQIRLRDTSFLGFRV